MDNVASSARTSNGGIHPALSEAEFLRLESQKARAAISQSLQNAKTALGRGVDPRGVMRKHPLLTIGAAAAAGFVATVVAIPSKEERELRHLERLQRAMNPPPPAAVASPQPESAKSAANGSAPAPKKPLWMTLLGEAIAVAKPILLAQITSMIRAEGVPPAPPQGPDKST